MNIAKEALCIGALTFEKQLDRDAELPVEMVIDTHPNSSSIVEYIDKKAAKDLMRHLKFVFDMSDYEVDSL